jgi:transposase
MRTELRHLAWKRSKAPAPFRLKKDLVLRVKADRYRVSLGMVKKLLQQRKRTGEIGPRHHCSGRKPMIVAAHHRKLEALLSQKPDMTLKELREAVELKCSLPAIHYALEEMGLTYKKRRSELANMTARTSRGRAERGVGDNWLGIPPARLIFIDESGAKTNLTRRCNGLFNILVPLPCHPPN